VARTFGWKPTHGAQPAPCDPASIKRRVLRSSLHLLWVVIMNRRLPPPLRIGPASSERPRHRLLACTLCFVAGTVSGPAHVAAQDSGNQLAEARRLLLNAGQLLPEIPEDQRCSAVSNIAGQLSRANDLPDALAVVHLLKRNVDQAGAIGSVIWPLAQRGDFAQSLTLIDTYVDAQNRTTPYYTLAMIQADKGDFAGAVQTARRIGDNIELFLDIVIRVATKQAKSGDLATARETFSEALNRAEEAARQNINHAVILGQIARAQAEAGDTSDAFVTLGHLDAMAQQSRETGGVELGEHVAMIRAQLGDVFGGLRALEQDPSSANSPIALMLIAEEQAKNGVSSEALETAARISDPSLRTAALREIAVIRGTHATVNEALDAIERIPQVADRAEALATLALEQAEKKNAAASQTVDVVWKLATEKSEEIDSDHFAHPGVVLGEIAVVRAMLGDFAGARQVVETIKQPEGRVWPLWNITSFLVEADRTQDALALADAEEAAYPKSYALLGTAQGILDRVEAQEKAHAQNPQ
jgi:hypothetical protein